MKFLLAFSLLDSLLSLNFLIPAGVILLVWFYLWYKVNRIRHKHISSKKLNLSTALKILFGRKKKSSKWKDFKSCDGEFTDKEGIHESIGGGVSGSW